jgi:GT2 family glycosyltransferase
MSDIHAPKGTITLALASGDRPEPHTMRTVLDMVMFDRELGHQHLHPSRPTVWVVGATFVTNARNRLVQRFLDQPVDSRADWLLFLDDDQLYPETLLEILIASADPVERRIVGLPVWRFTSKDDGPVRVTHNVFDVDEHGWFVEWPDELPENAVVQVAAVGTGCMLVHRTVLEEIRQMADDNGRGTKWCWFVQQVYQPADVCEGEDIWFCRMAAAARIPVWVNTSTTLQHAKTVMLQGPSPVGAYSIGGEPAPAGPSIVEPADEQVAVIVPVLNRPQNAAPFMRSLRASTGLANVYAVCSNDDDAAAWMEHPDVTVVKSEGVSFAEKVNDAYKTTTEPWVLLVGDDVRFHPGWLDHAQHVAHTTAAKVVGTNDLGNARVMRGEHAVHMLIARTYIDEHGASWDGPGVVCHEGYRHWFVDDEIVTVAKQRGEWAPATRSIVEHMHPLWGKSVDDDTYRLGQRSVDRDQRTYLKRLRRSELA